MRKITHPELSKYRIRFGQLASDDSYGNTGAFEIPHNSNMIKIIASDGEGWDHVSVSLKNRCPNWPEMCFIKNLFWAPEECVIQYHPPESEYVNHHPHCLHLWQPQNYEIPIPDSILVGPKIEKQTNPC